MSVTSSMQTDDVRAALSEFLVFLESQSPRIVARLVKYTHGEVQLQYGPLAKLLESGDFVPYMQEAAERPVTDDLEAQFRIFYDLFLLRDLLNKTPLAELMMLLQIVHSDNLPQRISQIEGVHGVLTQLGPAAISEIHAALAEIAGTSKLFEAPPDPVIPVSGLLSIFGMTFPT